MKKSSAIFIGILSFFVSLSVFFILAEIATRLFYDEKQNYGQSEWANAQVGVFAPWFIGIDKEEQKKVYINKDNQLYYNFNDNSLVEKIYGLYSPTKITKTKNEGVFRIAIVGDSFTVGYCCKDNLKNKNCEYPYQFQQLLNDKIKNDPASTKINSFEVFSFSYQGINSFQEAFLAKDLAMSYQPDLLILQYTDNDIQPMRNPYGTLPVAEKRDLIFTGNRIVPLLPYLSRDLNRLFLGHSSFLRFISYKLYVASSRLQDDENLSIKSVLEINNFAQNKNVPFWVINFTPASSNENYCGYVSNGWGKGLHDRLKKELTLAGASFYNMCDYVKDINSIKAECESGPHVQHYGKEGHRLAAEILKDAVFNLLDKK